MRTMSLLDVLENDRLCLDALRIIWCWLNTPIQRCLYITQKQSTALAQHLGSWNVQCMMVLD